MALCRCRQAFPLSLVLDQITKAVVRNALALGVPGPELIPGVIRLLYVQNVGSQRFLLVRAWAELVLLALAVIAATVWYLWKTPLLSHLEVVGLAMVVGGAVGNAIDRLTCGYVVDFFATEFIDLPVFNVADIGITAGVVLAFIGFTFFSPANKVDATEELNRRDAQARAKREAKRAARQEG